MPHTPSQRTTRSNSNPSTTITLMDIKLLIESTKTELLGKLSQEVDKLSGMLATLLHRVDDLDKKTYEIEKHCSESHALLDKEIKDLKKSSEINVSELMQEMEQRTFRSGNIIIFGLPELKEGTVEERKSADMAAVNELLSKIEADAYVSSPQTSHRLGKPSNEKPRPLRITGFNVAEKSEILRKARSLRSHDEYENTFVNPDLTPRQQRESKLLRLELKQRRQRGEQDLVIHNGKIVSKSNLRNFH